MKTLKKSFSNLKLDAPHFQSNLRIEQNIQDKPRKVNKFQFCMSIPKLRNKPLLIGLSKDAVEEVLQLDYQQTLKDKDSSHYLSGSKLLAGSKPICNNYCGYQFGNWAGQLGDGRAHLLGVYKNSKKYIQLQLKGSGLSPFSRHADGNSVQSSALRQFLVSELMNGLGVPTTRAASLVICDENVRRDPFYDGNIKIQKAAIVLRLASSFLRFGSFEVCNEDANLYSNNIMENRKIIQQLADFLLKHNYRHLQESEEMEPYEAMFIEIVQKSAKLVAQWQSLGFVHGVLNTDNMSMVGLTIDYGPFGFIDYFSKDYVSNATDNYQRYSYRQQPIIVKWNLNRLAQGLDCLIPQKILKRHINQRYDKIFKDQYISLIGKKLGLRTITQQEKKSVNRLAQQLFQIMNQYGSNFTNTFSILSSQKIDEESIIESLIFQSANIRHILANTLVYPSLLKIQNVDKIIQADPGFNRYLIEDQKLRIQKKSRLESHQFNQVKYIESQRERWRIWLKKYASYQRDRQIQKKSNPLYVLRNDVASNILKQIQKLDQTGDQDGMKRIHLFERVLKVMKNPYERDEWFQQNFWRKKCTHIKLTCSS